MPAIGMNELRAYRGRQNFVPDVFPLYPPYAHTRSLMRSTLILVFQTRPLEYFRRKKRGLAHVNTSA